MMETNDKTHCKWYYICALGMAAVIVFSLFGPQLAFDVQDYYRASDTEVKRRELPDVAKLNMGYEKDVHTRMNRFAQKNHYYTAVIEYDSALDEETIDSLLRIMSQEIFWIFLDGGLLPDIYTEVYDSDFKLTELKKYIIYGDDFNDGVGLMAWYFDKTISDGIRIQCLADVETDTVYYLKVSTENIDKNADYSESMEVWKESIYDLEWVDWEWSNYWNRYYETLLYQQVEEKGELYSHEINSEIKKKESMGLIDESDIEEMEETFTEYSVEADGESIIITLPLSYEDGQLHFRFCISSFAENPNLTVGISEIRELIPEFTLN